MSKDSLTLNNTELLLLGTLTVWCVLLTLYLGHWNIVSWKIRHQYWMKSRFSELELAMVTVFSQVYNAARPVNYYAEVRKGDQSWTRMDQTTRLIVFTANTLSLLPLTGTFMILCVRWWKLYYDAQMAILIGVSKWAVILDPSTADTEEQSWFVRNIGWLGNHAFLDKCGITIWIIVTVIGCVLPFISRLSESLFFTGFVIITLIFIGICGYLYPSFHDEIFLQNERRIFIRIMATITVGWFIWSQWFVLAGLTFEDHRNIRGVDSFLRQVWVSFGYPIAGTVMVPLVVQHFIEPKKSLNVCSLFILPVSFDLTRYESGNYTPESRTAQSNYRDEMIDHESRTLSKVISDNDAWNAFMIHLFAEFSYENALCLIECVKFRDRLRELNGITDLDDVNRKRLPELNFSENVKSMNSAIVSGMKSKEDARWTAQKIAEKYLRNDADFPVNLSYVVRKKVLTLIDDHGKPIEYTLFDHTIQANHRLLKESFSRFVETPAFANLELLDKRSSTLSFRTDVIKKLRSFN